MSAFEIRNTVSVDYPHRRRQTRPKVDAIWLVIILVCSLVVVNTGCMKTVRPDIQTADDGNLKTSNVWHDSFESALAESVSAGKPILADFTGSDWCVWCNRLSSEVFEKDQFIEWAHHNVVLLELDYPRKGRQSPEIKKQNAELAERYQIEAYPTLLLISPDGQVIGQTGYVKGGPTEMIRVIESMLDPVRSEP